MSFAAFVEGSLLAPLDAARRRWLTLVVTDRPLGALLIERDRRVASLATVHAAAALVAAIHFPVLLLLLGPIVFGVAHLGADVRTLILRRGSPRVRAALLVGVAALIGLRLATVCGLVSDVGRLELGAGPGDRVAIALAARRSGATARRPRVRGDARPRGRQSAADRRRLHRARCTATTWWRWRSSRSSIAALAAPAGAAGRDRGRRDAAGDGRAGHGDGDGGHGHARVRPVAARRRPLHRRPDSTRARGRVTALRLPPVGRTAPFWLLLLPQGDGPGGARRSSRPLVPWRADGGGGLLVSAQRRWAWWRRLPRRAPRARPVPVARDVPRLPRAVMLRTCGSGAGAGRRPRPTRHVTTYAAAWLRAFAAAWLIETALAVPLLGTVGHGGGARPPSSPPSWSRTRPSGSCGPRWPPRPTFLLLARPGQLFGEPLVYRLAFPRCPGRARRVSALADGASFAFRWLPVAPVLGLIFLTASTRRAAPRTIPSGPLAAGSPGRGLGAGSPQNSQSVAPRRQTPAPPPRRNRAEGNSFGTSRSAARPSAIRHGAQRPVNLGLRFARSADIPSRASSIARLFACSSASARAAARTSRPVRSGALPSSRARRRGVVARWRGPSPSLRSSPPPLGRRG